MKQKKTVPVLLITGYLGSGKTTLLNRILANKKGYKYAVIVNDIGEVNIDAALIEKGGMVGKKDDSLVALQNGCICCTLKMDLVEQINELMKMNRFDYIVIEASGICEPEPIAQTICSIPRMGDQYTKHGVARLDSIVTVVDALRLQSEFACGDRLTRRGLDEEDIENLIIQQIEFCNVILLNKASEVKREELDRIKAIIRVLQPKAEIIECDYADVDLDRLVGTGVFDYGRTAISAGWVQGIEQKATAEEEHRAKHPHDHDEEEEEEHGHHHHHDDDDDDDEHEHHHHHDDDDDDDEHEHHHHHHDDDDDDEHEHHHHDDDDDDEDEEGHGHHHHHHHHHHDEGEAEEYGIGTFVYYRRPAFDIHKFDRYAATKWPKSVIRCKGVIYFAHNADMCYIFEQAGVQKKLIESGLWYVTAPQDELEKLIEEQPDILRDWDEHYGDRMIKLVFIGQKMDKEQIIRDLDECLEL